MIFAYSSAMPVEIDESFCIKTLQGAHVILFDMAREVYFQE